MIKGKICCFVADSDADSLKATISSLNSSGSVDGIRVLTTGRNGENTVQVKGILSTDAMKKISAAAEGEYTLIYTKSFPLDLGAFALERMVSVCSDTASSMVYSAYYELKEGKLSQHPLIDYQEGSLRDDFSFGSLLLFPTEKIREACSRMNADYSFAGLYDLRLKVSQNGRLTYIPEFLYTEVETDTRKSGEKQFDYVDPKNRAVQVEMEKACTSHLVDIGAWLKPEFRKIEFDRGEFEYEASVIIPVKNRVKTISDAVKSVLAQEAPFRFNLIVVDNYSTDGTTEILKEFAASDSRVVHIIPSRKDLGIGGCWNEGVFSPKCGKFAIQLDSDDLYIDGNVVSRIVSEFYASNCGMVIGTYKMVNFALEEIPPGIIDHREWTPDNGRNNALRINGLGAPRAFYTPLLREIKIPNVSYGEDYAVGLAISRNYQIGRIYEPLYLCRRWDDNSDASLDIQKMNAHNFYKDKIRTIELLARKLAVKGEA